MPTEVGDRAKRNHILAYIEKNYPGYPVKEVSVDCFKVTTDTEIISVLADNFGKVSIKVRKRRGAPGKEAAPKVQQKVKDPTPLQATADTIKHIDKPSKPKKIPTNATNPLFENSEELKKHLSCDFLPGDKVKIKGNSEDVYEVDSLSLAQSGLEYVITKNHSDRYTVVNGDLEGLA